MWRRIGCLAEVGRRLQSKAPKGSLVARTGGDEFAVLLRAQGVEGAQATAVALQYVLVEPFVLDNFTLDVGAAVGIALYPDHASDADTMLQRADVATYAAKSSPRSIQIYRPAMESRSVHRFGLVSELRQGDRGRRPHRALPAQGRPERPRVAGRGVPGALGAPGTRPGLT